MKINENEIAYRELLGSRFDHICLTVQEVATATGYSPRECATKFKGWTGQTSGKRITIVQLAKELARYDA